jgi:hypothetical protein
MKQTVLGVLLSLVVIVTLTNLITATGSGQIPEARQAPQTLVTNERVCTLPEDLRYSRGALVRYQDSIYRCTSVRGTNFTPAGVVWVEVEYRNGVLTIKKAQ